METKRTALVTGGARGIGRAVALALASGGWKVAVCFRSSADAAAGLEAEVRAAGGACAAFKADVADPEAASGLVRRVESSWGRIDALVNCAGPFRRVPLSEETLEGWRSMFDANLHAVFHLTQLAAPGMKERGWGRIVNFSIARAEQLIGLPDIAAHYAAKAALLALTRAFARELAPHRITVNAISPGFIRTGGAPLDELSGAVRNIPAGHVGRPEDAAAAVSFLLSDAARYVTGANIPVGGGWGV